MSDESEYFAWVVLRVANRMQAKGSTARIIVPRDPEVVSEVAQELSLDPSDDDLLSAEEYLLECGYMASVDIGLTRGTYSLTPVGLDWLLSTAHRPLPTAAMNNTARGSTAQEYTVLRVFISCR